MTKVTVNKASEGAASPAQQMVAAANQEHLIEVGGRRIKLRKPGILAQVGLIRVMGPEDAKNDVLRTMYAPLLYVCEIDGATIMAPSNQLQLDALLQRMGEDGLLAVMSAVQEHFDVSSVESRDDVKN